MTFTRIQLNLLCMSNIKRGSFQHRRMGNHHHHYHHHHQHQAHRGWTTLQLTLAHHSMDYHGDGDYEDDTPYCVIIIIIIIITTVIIIIIITRPTGRTWRNLASQLTGQLQLHLNVFLTWIIFRVAGPEAPVEITGLPPVTIQPCVALQAGT